MNQTFNNRVLAGASGNGTFHSINLKEFIDSQLDYDELKYSSLDYRGSIVTTTT